MATIQNIIDNGVLSVPLCANYNATQKLFGGALAYPKSPVLIQMVADALNWMNVGGNYTNQEMTAVANYLIWLYGKFGLEASVITGNGGSVSPINPGNSGSSIYPFIITSASFESDGVSYDNPDIVGDNISIFINEYSQQWLQASGTTFGHTATGIEIFIPGFNANTDSYTIMIQKLNS